MKRLELSKEKIYRGYTSQKAHQSENCVVFAGAIKGKILRIWVWKEAAVDVFERTDCTSRVEAEEG